MDSMPFARAVKDARIAQRWSVSKAARKADIDRVTWGRIEQGLNVHELSIYAALAALDLDFDALMAEHERHVADESKASNG